jgi:hypothetical protein
MTRVIATVVVAMWMAAGAGLAGQDLRIAPGEPAAVRVSLENLAMHVVHLAGLRVRVADAIVERVVSPRAFILIGLRDVAGLGGRDRIGVVVESGTANVVQGMPVVVTGPAGTFRGAQVAGALPRASALTEAERDALSRYPLVVATSVETPGSINLLRPDLDTPTTTDPLASPAPAR